MLDNTRTPARRLVVVVRLLSEVGSHQRRSDSATGESAKKTPHHCCFAVIEYCAEDAHTPKTPASRFRVSPPLLGGQRAHGNFIARIDPGKNRGMRRVFQAKFDLAPLELVAFLYPDV